MQKQISFMALVFLYCFKSQAACQQSITSADGVNFAWNGNSVTVTGFITVHRSTTSNSCKNFYITDL